MLSDQGRLLCMCWEGCLYVYTRVMCGYMDNAGTTWNVVPHAWQESAYCLDVLTLKATDWFGQQ